MSELVYRKPCSKCAGTGMEPCYEPHPCGGEPCRTCQMAGFVEQVLDPDKVLIDDFDYEIRVSDVLAVLDGEDT